MEISKYGGINVSSSPKMLHAAIAAVSRTRRAGYLRGSVSAGLGIAGCVGSAWRLRCAWVGGVAYRRPGGSWSRLADRPVALPAAVCRVVGASSRLPRGCSRPCLPGPKGNAIGVSVQSPVAGLVDGAAPRKPGRGARRGASERRCRATSSDMQRLKLLVEPLPATPSHGSGLYGMQKVRGSNPLSSTTRNSCRQQDAARRLSAGERVGRFGDCWMCRVRVAAAVCLGGRSGLPSAGWIVVPAGGSARCVAGGGLPGRRGVKPVAPGVQPSVPARPEGQCDRSFGSVSCGGTCRRRGT